MRQNWMKLTNRLKLTLIGGLAVSASLVSALTFVNLTGSSNSFLAQNNSGNDNIDSQQPRDHSQSGGRGNTYYNPDNSQLTRTDHYHTDDHRSQQNTNCYGGDYQKSNCGTNGTVNNQ